MKVSVHSVSRMIFFLLSQFFLESCAKPRPIDPAIIELSKKFKPGIVSHKDAKYELPFQLYSPSSISANRLVPLIVYLHSSAVNGNDNISHLTPDDLGLLLKNSQAHEASYILAPQCPKGDKWVTGDTGAPHLNYSQKQRLESDSLRLTFQIITQLMREHPIDPDRIYITGASAGAAGTWDMITRRQNTIFAAAVPITGANDPSRAKMISKMPIWAFHGAKDLISPTQNTREMVAALRSIGSPIIYTEYPNIGHDSWKQAYSETDLFPWLFAQRKSSWIAKDSSTK